MRYKLVKWGGGGGATADGGQEKPTNLSMLLQVQWQSGKEVRTPRNEDLQENCLENNNVFSSSSSDRISLGLLIWNQVLKA